MNHRVKTIHTWAKSCRSSCENLQVINSQETSNERKILYDLLVLNKNCLSQSVVHVPALILNTADIMFHSDIWTAWHQNTVACKLQQSARPHLQVSEGDEKWSNSPVPAALQGWGQFRNWNWNWCQFQFQELELQRNWIKGIGIGIGIDKEELKELVQFLFLIVNSFWFFAMFLAESLNQFDLNPFWIQLTKISLDRYIVLYDNLSIKWILHGSYWLHL